MEKQLQPHLRFPEFDEDWNEKCISDILSIGSGKDYKHLNEGNIPVYGTGGLMTFVDNYIYEGESVGIGRKGTIDKPVFLTGKFWTVDTLFYTYKFSNSLPKFVYNLFQRINWRLYNEASGVPSLSKATIEKIKINIPSLPEQQKIADYLTTIDTKINLLEEKKEQLTLYKKAMMQKLFSQEICFKDDNGNDFSEWEEKKLGEIVDVRDGTHDSPKYINESKYFLITSKNLNENGKFDFNDIKYLKEEDYNKINQRSKVEEDDILFGMIGTIGNPVIVKGDINFAIKNMALLKKSNLVNTNFLFQLFKSSYIENLFKRLNTGNTQKFISLSQIRNLDILYPSLSEQQKIANFLSAIDESIEKVNEQISQTQSFKKAMLQQMFL